MTSKIEKIPDTLEELLKIKNDNFLSVGEVLTRIRELENIERDKVEIPEYKLRPSKHDFIGNSHSPKSKELRAYADAVEEYEKHEKKIRRAHQKQRNATPNSGELLIGLIKHESGLKDIPEKYQDKVYNYAYEQGHANGFHEVYNYLQELVNIFE